MPITATIAVLAALSLAAFPPTLGFIGKEAILDALLSADKGAVILSIALVLASIVFVAVAGIFAIQPFFGKNVANPERRHEEAPPSLWLGPMLLAAVGILVGIAPSIVEDSLLRPAVQAIVGAPVTFHLSLWHGFNRSLALSVLASGCGMALYAGRRSVHYAAITAANRFRVGATALVWPITGGHEPAGATPDAAASKRLPAHIT